MLFALATSSYRSTHPSKHYIRLGVPFSRASQPSHPPHFRFELLARLRILPAVMLRRVLALILAFTCAFAPGLAAFEAAPAEDCCCSKKCPCPVTECAPPAATPSAKTANPASAVEQRIVTKARARVARAAFAHFVSTRSAEPLLSVRAGHARAERPAASVALFQAHCSLLI